MRYVFKRHHKNYFQDYLLFEKKCKIIKTPSYVDFEAPLAQMDMDDYLIELSAKLVNAKILTFDRKFIIMSDLAMDPDDFYEFALTKTETGIIPFLDLKTPHIEIYSALESAFDKVIKSGYYILGNEVTQFEQEFAAYCGSKYCVGVGNGLDALTLTLRAWKELGKLKEGDEIIVPANTYIATILAITENRLTPVLVDPDLQTYDLSPELMQKAITSRTKAVMPVHLYGRLAEMPEIMTIAENNDLLVVALPRLMEQACMGARPETGAMLRDSVFILERILGLWAMQGL